MRVYFALFILIPVSCATGEGVWCRNNCAEIKNFKEQTQNGRESRMVLIPKDFQLFDDCKVEMCADKETCNTIVVDSYGTAAIPPINDATVMYQVATTSCGTRKHDETVPDQECIDKGVFAAFQKASQANKITFTMKNNAGTRCVGKNSVCMENCVPVELIPQDNEKEKFEKSSATCPTLGAVLVAGTAVLLH
jgi:hypothetical protein